MSGTEACPRCGGTGTVHVTTYGGHDVDCGMCRGAGHTEAEDAEPVDEDEDEDDAPSLAEFFEALVAALDAFVDADRAPTTGPPVRRQRRPRDHPTNTGITARSRAAGQSTRNALRRL